MTMRGKRRCAITTTSEHHGRVKEALTPDKGDLFIESPTSSNNVSEIFCVAKRHNIVRDNLSIK